MVNLFQGTAGFYSFKRQLTHSSWWAKITTVRPQVQLFRQLPTEHFSVAVNSNTRKPTTIKAKAVHLEIVSDLTTEALIAALRSFIARRGGTPFIRSDHGSKFIGANNELKDLQNVLPNPSTHTSVSNFCTANNVQWKFIPESSPLRRDKV